MWARRAAILFVVGLGLAASAAFADRLALWTIVHDQCVAHAKAGERPTPCTAVDLTRGEERGTAVLKDRNGRAQYLLIPTVRVAGLESPELLAADVASYWSAAWAARTNVETALGRSLPRGAMMVAVNSARARSIDQLHFHVDCAGLETIAALEARAATLGSVWEELEFPAGGRKYHARRIESDDLADVNPVKLAVEELGVPQEARDGLSVAAVGAVFGSGKPGFILLADFGGRGHLEDLQDHDCAVARGP